MVNTGCEPQPWHVARCCPRISLKKPSNILHSVKNRLRQSRLDSAYLQTPSPSRFLVVSSIKKEQTEMLRKCETVCVLWET